MTSQMAAQFRPAIVAVVNMPIAMWRPRTDLVKMTAPTSMMAEKRNMRSQFTARP